MSRETSLRDTRRYVKDFRQYVLGPVSTAQACVEYEWSELNVEIDAFEQFHDVIGESSPKPRDMTVTTTRTILDDPQGDAASTLRDAYRDTVMAVPHYDDEYGDSLAESLAMELEPEVAAILLPDTGIAFTPTHKAALEASVERAIDRRTSFLNVLDIESESLATAEDAISDLTNNLDETVIQPWYRREFEQSLTEVSERRQATLCRFPNRRQREGHSLCEYLYAEEPWTYPVLTAVARLRSSVVVDQPDRAAST